MFSFFKKFKGSSDTESDGKSASCSPATPARRTKAARDSSSEVHRKQEQEVDMACSSDDPPEDLSMTQDEEAVQRNGDSAPWSTSLEKLTVLERQVEDLETEKRSLVSQEAKFQEQLAELTAQLTARDNESNKLRYQMEDLQRDVLIKGSGMDRLQAELAAAHKESECVRRRLRQLEDDLTSFKHQNRELQDELQRKAEEMQNSSTEEDESDDDSEQVAELENKVKELEDKVLQLQAQLDEVRTERDKLAKDLADVEAEREKEMKIVELALEDALEQKALIQVRFEQDFEKLRTVNTDREQQLLDDFEWKLREVEQACKRRLEEKDKMLEERVRESRKELELKLKLAEQQLSELPQLKTYEAEVAQLRGLTHEQQRSLRVASRQTEQLQVSERILKEEMTRLKTQLDREKSHVICMQSLHEKKMSDNEKKFQARLDQQKSDITAQWEDRLRRECSRLKAELDQLHSEEKHLAVESVKVQKEQELRAAKQSWERRMQECLNEVSTLKDRLTEKDTYYHGELEKAQTNADRDVFDLRRKLDKIDLSYQEQMEKLAEKHEREIEQLNEESERKIQQLEQNWQLQMSSTRATLELVKEQMERDAQDRLDAAEERHRKQLDIQWERLVNDKEQAVAELEEKHQTQVDLIRTELEGKEDKSHRENELLETIANLKKQLQGQTAVITDLQGNVDLLQGGMQVLNQEINTQNQEMQRIQVQATHKLREREAQLEAEQRRKLAELKERSLAESKQWQEQLKLLRDQFQQKLNYLVKLLRETEQKYEKRESRTEDVDTIAHLKQALEEREREVTCLTEEKRFYQLELMNREKMQMLDVQHFTKNLDPVQYHRKKGLTEGHHWEVTASSVPPLVQTSSVCRLQKSKSLEARASHVTEPANSSCTPSPTQNIPVDVASPSSHAFKTAATSDICQQPVDSPIHEVKDNASNKPSLNSKVRSKSADASAGQTVVTASSMSSPSLL